MAKDALDPGPLGDFPFWPRKPTGEPDPERMPTGTRRQRTPDGRVVVIDETPRYPQDDPLGRAGQPIIPPNRS